MAVTTCAKLGIASRNQLANLTERQQMKLQTEATCQECGQVFDLFDVEQAEEFYYGHDCEVSE